MDSSGWMMSSLVIEARCWILIVPYRLRRVTTRNFDLRFDSTNNFNPRIIFFSGIDRLFNFRFIYSRFLRKLRPSWMCLLLHWLCLGRGASASAQLQSLVECTQVDIKIPFRSGREAFKSNDVLSISHNFTERWLLMSSWTIFRYLFVWFACRYFVSVPSWSIFLPSASRVYDWKYTKPDFDSVL